MEIIFIFIYISNVMPTVYDIQFNNKFKVNVISQNNYPLLKVALESFNEYLTASCGSHAFIKGILNKPFIQQIVNELEQIVFNRREFHNFEFGNNNELLNTQNEDIIEGVNQINDDFKNYIDKRKNHYDLLFKRLLKDENIIQEVFLVKKDYSLCSIKFLHSDSHKIGDGVSELIFCRQDMTNVEQISIIYKTSPVMADFLTVGKVKDFCKNPENAWLKTLCSSMSDFYKGSFIEFVNESIKDDNRKIKTYKILPMFDKNSDKINELIQGAYGYLDYLDDGRIGCSIPLEFYKKFIREGYHHTQLEDLVNYHNLQQIKEKLFRDENSEILSLQLINPYPEVTDFFFKIGVISAFLNFNSSLDLHKENFLVIDNDPVMIDMENTFIPVEIGDNTHPSFMLTSLSNGIHLQLNKCSHYDIFYYEELGKVNFLRYDGFYKTNAYYQSQNILNKPDMKSHNEGVKFFLSLMEQSADFLESFYKSKIFQQTIIREIPMGTEILNGLTFFNNKELKQAIKNNIEEMDYHHSSNRNFKLIGNNDTFEKISNGFIPSFFASTISKDLFSSEGKNMNICESFYNKEELGPYYKETPQEFMLKRIKNFSKDNKIWEYSSYQIPQYII